jgi:hypothetical protein
VLEWPAVGHMVAVFAAGPGHAGLHSLEIPINTKLSIFCSTKRNAPNLEYLPNLLQYLNME